MTPDSIIRTFALVGLLLLARPMTQVLDAQPQPQADQATSTWWFPRGDAAATRNNGVPTSGQQPGDLTIKWRQTGLPQSSVLLVGSIRPEPGGARQQVVGSPNGSTLLTVVTSGGYLDTTWNLQLSVQNMIDIVPTGLFDSSAATIESGATPNLIGVGVRQRVGTASLPAGLLLNRDGDVVNRLGLFDTTERNRVARFSSDSNRIVTIYPIAVWKNASDSVPMAITLLSQNSFERTNSGEPIDTMLNSIRKYHLARGRDFRFAAPLARPFYFAPKAYASPPALKSHGGRHLAALSTGSYRFDSAILVNPATSLHETSSNNPHAINIELTSSPTIPNPVSNDGFPGAGATSSFFETLTIDRTAPLEPQEREVRVIFERGRQVPAEPRIQMTQTATTAAEGRYVETDNENQGGWDVIPVDLDGSASDQGGTDVLVNNPGPELAAITTPAGSFPPDRSWVYLFRRNQRVRIPPSNADFFYFTRAPIRGRIAASGDIYADPDNRQELVRVDRNRLTILQLKPYSKSEEIRRVVDSTNRPFYELDSFELPDSILTVAIADLEGDGENDLIVSTRSGVVAIGVPPPNPYPISGPGSGTEFCANDTITFRWRSDAYGSGRGRSVMIVGERPQDTLRLSPQRVAGDSLRVRPVDLAITRTGQYRLVVMDADFHWISDTSDPFRIVAPSLGSLELEPFEAEYAPGMQLTDTVPIACLDSVTLQRKIGSGDWESVEGDASIVGQSRAAVNTVVPTYDPGVCGAEVPEEQVQYRLVALGDTTESILLTVRHPEAEVRLDPGDTSVSRTRTALWESDDFPCDSLRFTIARPDGNDPADLAIVDPNAESFPFVVPESLSDSLILCVRCADGPVRPGDIIGLRAEPIDESNYVAPNPFDPEGSETHGRGADIVFRLQRAGRVSVVIYDPGRRETVRLVDGEEMKPGGHHVRWDGANARGDRVANGTYICVISSTSGEQIILPIAVVKGL